MFCGKLREESWEISFEIGMLGRHGLDINNPKETHALRARPGRTFSEQKIIIRADAANPLI